MNESKFVVKKKKNKCQKSEKTEKRTRNRVWLLLLLINLFELKRSYAGNRELTDSLTEFVS